MYVAITKDLTRAVRNLLAHMEHVERDTTPYPEAPKYELKAREQYDKELHERLWLRQLTWGVLCGTPFENHKDLVFHNTREVNVRITELDDVRFGPEGNLRLVGRHETRADVELYVTGCPYHFHHFTTYPVSRTLDPFLDAWATVHVIRKEAEHRWAAIATQVAEFMDNCKSLNEALKLWPDLAQYIPSEYIARVAEKVEKKKAGPSEGALKALAAIDMNKVAASNVIHRMNTAGKTADTEAT